MAVSMKVVTILQLIGVFVIYFGMTVLLPALIFHRKLQKECFAVRFLAYALVGNFYLMNLVFILQLLHISNRYTLLVFTVVPAAWAGIRINELDVKGSVLHVVEFFRRFFEGTMGIRLIFSNLCQGIRTGLKSTSRKVKDKTVILDWIGIALVVVLILRLFGSNLLNTYGYCASDIPVHNYWINALCNNHIFVAGVYPYGFHCVVYYIHEVFGFKVFVLLRVFCLVQTLMVHLVLLAFLKLFCRTRYMPYLAFVLYTFGNFWNRDVVSRFYASLPQEFGMIFILPAAAFLLLFFSERGKENGQKGLRVHSTLYLVLFAMSFSMTLAAHFYNTMIIGLFCVGIAAGHLGLLFRKAYFGRIMLAGIVSVVVAVLPMGIAYAAGTPLEGSLRWGMSIIQSSSEQEVQDSNTTDAAQEPDTTRDTTVEPDMPHMSETEAGSMPETVGQQGAGETLAEQPRPAQPPLGERIAQKWEKVKNLLNGLQRTVSVYVLNRIQQRDVALWLLSVPVLAALGGISLLFKRSRLYGSMLISVSVYVLFLLVVLMSPWFGIPSLMDASRCSIYLAYSLGAAAALCMDAIVSLAFGRLPYAWIMHGISLAGVAALAVWIGVNGRGKPPFYATGLETNGAITCLTNILKDEKNHQFTICSANDELRMVEEYGYHVETITFLRGMEGNRRWDYYSIPTPRIYFFIEKIPGDYTMSYAGSGRTVSDEGADHMLPGGAGLAMYKGESRYIVMSRMYYWAQAFQKLYPTEMRVYFETDDFICYVVEQNPYRLFDLSIDYGYNVR